jgi:hypothetical protein
MRTSMNFSDRFQVQLSIVFCLQIIWNRHGHECSLIWKLSDNFIKKCRDFLGRDILGTTFYRAESSLIQSSCRSFIRVIVPYEISKVNFRVEKQKLLSVCQKRFNKLKNINISKTSWQNDFYYTRVPGFSGIGRTREGTRLQDHIYALC